MRTEPDGPIWDLNFFGSGKLAQLDHRDTAFRNASKIDKQIKGSERPGDDLVWWLGVVREPNRCGDAGCGLLPDFFCEDGCAVAALGKNDATGQTRHACANDCDCSIHYLKW